MESLEKYIHDVEHNCENFVHELGNMTEKFDDKWMNAVKNIKADPSLSIEAQYEHMVFIVSVLTNEKYSNFSSMSQTFNENIERFRKAIIKDAQLMGEAYTYCIEHPEILTINMASNKTSPFAIAINLASNNPEILSELLESYFGKAEVTYQKGLPTYQYDMNLNPHPLVKSKPEIFYNFKKFMKTKISQNSGINYNLINQLSTIYESDENFEYKPHMINPVLQQYLRICNDIICDSIKFVTIDKDAKINLTIDDKIIDFILENFKNINNDNEFIAPDLTPYFKKLEMETCAKYSLNKVYQRELHISLLLYSVELRKRIDFLTANGLGIVATDTVNDKKRKIYKVLQLGLNDMYEIPISSKLQLILFSN